MPDQLSNLILPVLDAETQQIQNIEFMLPGAGQAGINSISVNGVQQSVANHAVDLDIASNLITEAQWTEICNIFT